MAKQSKKFPFHFFFRFAAEGWGEETQGKCKEIFWFLHTRVRERVRGTLSRITTQSGRTERFRATTRSARAISSFRQGSARNAVELRSIHTAGFCPKCIRTLFNTLRQLGNEVIDARSARDHWVLKWVRAKASSSPQYNYYSQYPYYGGYYYNNY